MKVPQTFEWAAAEKLPNYINNIVPNPKDARVLVLNSPSLDLITDLVKIGTQIDIVESDSQRSLHFLDTVKAQKFALHASKTSSSIYTSDDGRVTLHNIHFYAFHPQHQFNAIFDIGFLPSLPHPEARHAFGDKLIGMAAEKCRMILMNVETFEGKKGEAKINDLSFYDISLSYGRGFDIKKELEVANPAGFQEQVFIAEKMAAGAAYYDAKYSKGYSPWHVQAVNYNLNKHYSRIQPDNEPLRKILIPMCGKTVDIKWLADKGHEVVAIEISPSACGEIFARDNIAFHKMECPPVKGTLYKSEDGKIRVYCCDVFNFKPEIEGLFNSVWERGAVIALDDELRRRYFAQIKTLVAKGCTWMTSVFQYDREIYYNHPYCVNDDEIRATFEDDFKVESVDETVFLQDQEYVEDEQNSVLLKLLRRAKVPSISDRVYVLSKK